MKLLKSLLGSLVTLVLLLAGLLYFMTWTEPGLQLLGKLGVASLGGGFSIESIHGRLGRSIEIRGLKLVLDGDRYEIAELNLTWSPRQLFDGRLRIDRLSANQVSIQIGGNSSFSLDEVDFSFPYPQLPFVIQLVEADIRDIEVTGISDQPLHARELRLAALGDVERLQIASLQLLGRGIDATLAGEIGLQAAVDSDLELQWTYTPGSEETLTTSGRLAAQGRLRDYRMQAQASVGGGIPAGDWTLSGTGDLRHLSIARLNGRTLDGTVEGTGSLTWSPALQWEANLAVKDLNPGRHWRDWPGQLSGRMNTSGEASDETWRLALAVEQLTGTLRGYPVAGQADIARDGGNLAIRRLRLTSGKNVLTASGTLADRWSVNTRLVAPDLAALLPDWSGVLEATASIGGNAARPRIDAHLDGRTIAGPALSMQALRCDLALGAQESADQSVSARMDGMELGNLHYEQATLDFSGTWQKHRLVLAAAGEEQRLDVEFGGGWQAQRWRGMLEQAQWRMPHTGLWILSQPVALTLGPQHVEIPDTCLMQDLSQLCLHAGGDPRGTLDAALRLERFPLTVLEEMFTTPVQFTSLVDAQAAARLKAGRLDGADLTVRLGAGGFSYDDPALPTETYLDQGALSASLDKQGVSADLHLDLAGSDYLDAGMELPGYRPQATDWRDQALTLKVTGDLRDLLIVKYLLEDIGSFRGALNVALQGTGTLGNPLIAGSARLSDATLAIDRLGIELSRLNLDLQSRDDGLSLAGSAVSGKGQLALTGAIAFKDIASWEADISLQGTDFEAMHQPEALILVSPDLQARISPPEIHLSGELHVPRARLRPRDLAGQTGRSSDVIIMDAKTPAPSAERWLTYSKVHLSLGDDVDINGFGLKGDLLGAIDLNDKPGQTTRAQGTLSVERGTYEAYGSKLDIERGRLLFNGGPVDNPGLDFRASRKIQDITAGISVGGTLKMPELTLYSDPVMSESDIISYISFGRPMSQVGTGGGSATSSGLIAGGNVLGGMVGSSVGLEELGVEDGDSADEAAMVLGTYITPQLYVRYRTGLYEAINEFHVLYDFTRNWGIRTVSSIEKSSAELRFSFER
jgi:translocation and assembly module TamB